MLDRIQQGFGGDLRGGVRDDESGNERCKYLVVHGSSAPFKQQRQPQRPRRRRTESHENFFATFTVNLTWLIGFMSSSLVHEAFFERGQSSR
jgi:hypothetical protein